MSVVNVFMLFHVSEYQNEWLIYTYGLIIFYRQDNPMDGMVGLISTMVQSTIMKQK